MVVSIIFLVRVESCYWVGSILVVHESHEWDLMVRCFIVVLAIFLHYLLTTVTLTWICFVPMLVLCTKISSCVPVHNLFWPVVVCPVQSFLFACCTDCIHVLCKIVLQTWQLGCHSNKMYYMQNVPIYYYHCYRQDVIIIITSVCPCRSVIPPSSTLQITGFPMYCRNDVCSFRWLPVRPASQFWINTLLEIVCVGECACVCVQKKKIKKSWQCTMCRHMYLKCFHPKHTQSHSALI